MNERPGSLTAVGIGIRSAAQATLEAIEYIKNSECVFTLVSDPVTLYWVRTLNANAESLGHFYAEGKDRRETYREIIERVTSAVREGHSVCAVSYGHPGVAAYPFHESIRRLRDEGYPAEMLPGISSEDCLFAELGVDPTVGGCMSYEATDFLLRRRTVDPASNLILWQIGVIAEPGYKRSPEAWNRDGLGILARRLLENYSGDHEVVVYEASRFAPCAPLIERTPLANLPHAHVTTMSTLFVPPSLQSPLDEEMALRLGMK